ncbi:MAG: hypothetical protein HY016_12850 [Nitrosomonadales bacterium]|nr:hypothetical protein [Nitrosomonadales bacterium]
MFKFQYPLSSHFLGILCIALLSGCATRFGDSITVPMGELAMYDAVPKEKSIARIADHLSNARSENMPFLAPHYFREAADIVDKIKRLAPEAVSAEDLAKADALLDKGESVSMLVRSTFANELELKDKLDELKANEVYPWEYKALTYQLSNLIEQVELNNASNIEREKATLNQLMQEFHAKAAQSSHK